MADYDYVIVGSGAGGGPLAANLAKAGFSVLLLEAGLDSCAESEVGRLMYEVPLFHGFSTEYQGCAWNFYVRHYADDAQQAKDSKFLPGKSGVWYPRAGTLGGCTAHNAMITIVPQDSDWNYIAAVTGDRSWSADKIRPYFSRIENCSYVSRPDSIEGAIEAKVDGALSSIAELLRGREGWRDSAHGHGFSGWLTTSEADPKLVLKDPEILLLLLNSAKEALKSGCGDPLLRTETRFDPNDSRNAEYSPEGLAFTPLSVKNGKRIGPREYLLRTQQAFPHNLTIQTGALATRVLFEGAQTIGVEFLEGAHLYEADPRSGSNSGVKRQVRAGREVILCGGAFNSPQLLLLSGVGPRAQLEQFGIPVVRDLPGVGMNLQDRYEIAVVSQFRSNFTLMEEVPFHAPEAGAAPDPYLLEWEQGSGLYASNGTLIGIVKRSTSARRDPDLYMFGMPGDFRGYAPGYSSQLERYRDRFTWAILKARTNNTAGRVSLRSSNPLAAPRIDFHYFDEGNAAASEDLDSIVTAVEFVRDMNSRLAAAGLIKEELTPGPAYQSREQLREFIRNEAWGHHASCSNRMGGDGDAMAVLDSRFRVRGTAGLRVVDASVFPRIPGYFIVTAVYMASEKAADVIAEDAASIQRGG